MSILPRCSPVANASADPGVIDQMDPVSDARCICQFPVPFLEPLQNPAPLPPVLAVGVSELTGEMTFAARVRACVHPAVEESVGF